MPHEDIGFKEIQRIFPQAEDALRIVERRLGRSVSSTEAQEILLHVLAGATLDDFRAAPINPRAGEPGATLGAHQTQFLFPSLPFKGDEGLPAPAGLPGPGDIAAPEAAASPAPGLLAPSPSPGGDDEAIAAEVAEELAREGVSVEAEPSRATGRGAVEFFIRRPDPGVVKLAETLQGVEPFGSALAALAVGEAAQLQEITYDDFRGRLLDRALTSEADVTKLQEGLVKAGLLEKDSYISGWLDQVTDEALFRVALEASLSQTDLQQILRDRATVADKFGGGTDGFQKSVEAQYRQRLLETYFRAWGKAPPPGEIERAVEQGVDEETYEMDLKKRSGWLASPQATDQRGRLEAELAPFFGSFG